MLPFVGAICLCLSLLVGVANCIVLTAALDYGTFQGTYSPEYNISYWQKIPFAAPPIGQNRFRAPQPPRPIRGIYNSSQTFDMCPQRTINGSEDCLYLGLYSRPWTQGSPLRPVVVTFYGGGFIQGSASFASLPPSAYPILNVSAAGEGMMFVYPNYRVNAFGFLPGKQVEEDPFSDANAGLLDQERALRWTQKYIALFGGDPDRVTVWGQSAGGGSVLAQVIADHEHDRSHKHNSAISTRRGRGGNRNQNKPKPLFRQALASSPFWPKTYLVDSPEAQWRYDTLANLTGCSGPKSLQCLKSVDVQKIRDANLVIVDSHKYTTSTFEWGPVIDGVFLREPLSVATAKTRKKNKAEKGKRKEEEGEEGSVIVAGYAMYNTHEGENFVPTSLKNTGTSPPSSNTSETSSFDAWLEGYLPALSPSDLRRLKKLYPEIGSAEHVENYDDAYTRAGLVYRDSTLACPAYWMAGSATDGNWLGEYTISPAQHASDVYWWNTVNPAQQTDPLHYKGYAGALASFFMTGDPNALKLTADDVAGVPDLKTGREWAIDSAGFTNAKIDQLEERCSYWKEVAPKIPI